MSSEMAQPPHMSDIMIQTLLDSSKYWINSDVMVGHLRLKSSILMTVINVLADDWGVDGGGGQLSHSFIMI